MPEPLLNNDGIVHLEKKTGVGCCIYQFSLSLFAHYLFVVAWRRPILGPAGCPVRMASPKISSSQRWPFCSFATADVCRSKKAALSHSLFLVFATSLVFSDFFFFFFSSWKNINWNEGKFQKTNTGFIQYGNLYSSYISYTNNPNVKSQSAYSICTSKEIQIRKWCLQSRIVKLLNITDMTASPCTKVLISFRFSAPSPSIFLSWVYWEWRGSLVKYIPYRMSFAPSCCRMRRNSFFSGCLHMRWLAWDYISKVFVRACSMLQWVGGNRWVCPCKNRVNMVCLKMSAMRPSVHITVPFETTSVACRHCLPREKIRPTTSSESELQGLWLSTHWSDNSKSV